MHEDAASNNTTQKSNDVARKWKSEISRWYWKRGYECNKFAFFPSVLKKNPTIVERKREEWGWRQTDKQIGIDRRTGRQRTKERKKKREKGRQKEERKNESKTERRKE